MGTLAGSPNPPGGLHSAKPSSARAIDPAGFRQALDRLRFARHEVVVVHVTSPDDAQPALDGEVTIEDVDSGETRDLLVTPVAGTCRERGILCFQIGSDVPFEDAVLRILRAGGVVA